MKNDQTFIALDIETTGFDAATDAIIEVAAVKFDREKVLDTWSSLLNPGREIPPMVEHITGISQGMLTDAPSIDEKKEEIINFIGSDPIVGHNISFDLTFLNQKGVFLNNEGYDTLQLSGILLPGYPSYSLDTLTRLLNIQHEDKHRALSDTIAAQKLFLILLEKIDQIHPDTRHQINGVIEKSVWPMGELFKHHQQSTAARHKKAEGDNPQKESAVAGKKEDILPLLENFFEANGPLSKTIPDYEGRDSQQEIAQNILDSFEKEEHFLVEAGTGTGKTLAYLTGALRFALKNHEKVVISTYTKNLQEQLMGKEIPLLKKALGDTAPDAWFTALKGKRNYLSIKRFRKFLEKSAFQEHEAGFAIKILLWLEHTKFGELDELNMQGKEFSLLDDVCYDETDDASQAENQAEKETDEDSPVNKNPFDGNEGFLKLARRRAEQAKIVIVNHALLLQDAQSDSPIIPEYDHVVFDEAHHLEKVTTDTFTHHFSFTSFARPYEKLISFLSGDGKKIAPTVRSIHERITIFFGLLGILMEKINREEQSSYQAVLKPQYLSTLEWQKVQGCAAQLQSLIQEVLPALEETAAEQKSQTARRTLRGLCYHVARQQQMLGALTDEKELHSRINWLFKAHEGNACFKSAPAQAGPLLRQLFFDAKKSVTLISATLRVDGNFEFIKNQLGLDRCTRPFTEKYLPSHFDYPDQVKIIIPEDMPRPASEGNFVASCQVIEDTIRANGGRTLILFTSKRALSAAYMQLAPRMKEEGITILAQGMSGGRGKILEHFKQEPQTSALFGTASFWEGIDIPGSLLTCVVIQKLPFDPPDDPIIFFRGQNYTDAFNDFQLPRAILRFKQGFGRLIRTSKDRGTIVILDSRIIQNSYGQHFLSSLPEQITLQHCFHEDIAKYIKSPVE